MVRREAPVFEDSADIALDIYEGFEWRAWAPDVRNRARVKMREALLSLDGAVDVRAVYPSFLCDDGLCSDCAEKGYCP